jgi:hypothetical protein
MPWVDTNAVWSQIYFARVGVISVAAMGHGRVMAPVPRQIMGGGVGYLPLWYWTAVHLTPAPAGFWLPPPCAPDRQHHGVSVRRGVHHLTLTWRSDQ